MDSTTISTEIKKLSIAERILLVEELWNSILSDQDKLELTSSQRDELDSRLKDYHESPEKGSSWNEVKTRITADK